MKLTRFFAATHREAMRQVRLALGPDALIVSNRRVNGGVEIVATDQTAVSDTAVSEAAVLASASASSKPEAGTEPLMDALGAMRGELLGRIDELTWGNQLRQAPRLLGLFQTLLSCGFSTALLRAMLKSLPSGLAGASAFQWARNELITHLPLADASEEYLQPGAVIALVGPTGVGKTTTIAKLAARCVRRLGAENIAMITTDTYRIGAYEQLKQYGQMMKIPVGVAKNPDELSAMLRAVPASKIVLVDNVGVSQRDGHVITQTAMLTQMPRPVVRLLVLNAASHGDTLDEVARRYAVDPQHRLAGCIITKIDESSRLAPVIDTVIRYRLPIHYLSNGQRVPQDLVMPDAVTLVDRALSRPTGSRPLYAPTEADFAALIEASRRAGEATARQADTLPARQLLASLLPSVRSDQTFDQIARAAAHIDHDIACFQAYGLWRQRHDSQDAKPDNTTAVRQLTGAGLGQAKGEVVWAVHDDCAVRHNRVSGRLYAATLFDGSGQALCSPWQQLGLAGSWHETAQPVTNQATPSFAARLSAQIEGLGQLGLTEGTIHLIRGGSQALWRSLSETNVHWVARCTAKTMVRFNGSRMVVAAAARALRHEQIELTVQNSGISAVGAVPLGQLTIWGATASGTLEQKGHDALPVRIHSLVVRRRADNAVIMSVYALSNLASQHLTEAIWPAGLLLQAEAATAYQYAAALWPSLLDETGVNQPLDDALFAMQAGLALWSVLQSVGNAQARDALFAISGGKRAGRKQLVRALCQLYAIKAILN